MNNANLGYAAGIIDGEGTILITKLSNYPHALKCAYRLVTELGMCDEIAPTWMHNTFGGRLKGYDRPDVKHKRVYRWNITDSQAMEFLKLILPYLKTKRAQAEIAIEYQETKLANRAKYIYRKPAVFLEVEAILAEKIHKLNQGAADDA